MLTTRSATSRGTAFVSSFSMTLFLLLLSSCCFFPYPARAATSDEWRTRSIYQIITDRFARTDGSTTYECDTAKQLYCGGSFQGIINQLDYIQGMGFTAIWISPVVQGINATTKYGQGYHGFWTQDITKINSNFGTSDDLKALSKAVHDRGMYIMIDVVVNNMAYPGAGAKVDYSTFVPFNKQEYFHNFCFITDYANQTNAQDCWLGDDVVALADLDTESTFVQETWQNWITGMVADYSLDGLRIDAAKHVDKPFWPGFQSAAGIFTIGEVFDQDPNATCYWAVDALSSVLNYPAWYSIVGTLANSSNPMGGLGYIVSSIASECHDATLLGTFSENHDVARFGSATSDLSQQKNALTFNLMTDGIPVVYYGAEQRFTGENDPGNREALWLNPTGYDTNATLYQHVKALNTVRSAVGAFLEGTDYSNWSGYWAYKSKILYSTDDILVFRKGYDTSIITAMTNGGVGSKDVGPYHLGDTNLATDTEIIEVLSCKKIKVEYDGEFNITLTNGEPQVWVPAKYILTTSGLCTDLIKEINRTGSTLPASINTAGRQVTPSLISSSLGSLGLCILVTSMAMLFSGS